MTEALFIQFTALLAAALLIPSFVFFAYGVNHRKMTFWWVASLAYFMIFFGAGLAAFRNILPEIPITFISNTLIGYGYLLSVRSVRLLKGYTGYNRIENLLFIFFLTSLIFVVFFANTYQNRVSLVSLYISCIFVLAFIVTYQSRIKNSALGDVALLVFAIGNTIFAMLRGSTAMLDSELSFLAFGFWDQVFFVWSISAVFCFAIGLFMNGTALIIAKTKNQLLEERNLRMLLAEALEGQRNLKKLILHELKRPLNALTVSVDMSRKRYKGMTTEEVERIHRLTCDANQYLRGISDYEDIDAIIDNLTIEEVTISRLVEDIQNRWQIDIEVLPAVKATLTLVDLLLFDVAIGNLLENAQKFGSNQTNVAMKVELVHESINFDVVDDGTGIPPSETEKVFQQFYKIDGVETNAVTGCGLGLYMARRIAKALGGRCDVVSQEPSIIRFSLPVLLDKEGVDVSTS